MGVTVYSLSGKEWINALRSSNDFINSFPMEYAILIAFVKYIDEECDGWSKYYIRLKKLGEKYSYISELYFLDRLGKDKLWDFVVSNKGVFGWWLKSNGDDYILKSIKEYNSSIMDFKYNWFNKDDDMFISLCCKFIRDITIKLIRYVKINEV